MLERYFEINRDGHNIRCKLCFEKGHDIRKAIVFCHGFAGHKDNTTAFKFSERAISKHPSTATIVFDLPCHGNDVKKKLTLDDCLKYIELVADYTATAYPNADLYAHGTSFGGYLFLNYLSHMQHSYFKKIVLLSPAINMYDSITSSIIPAEDLLKINKGKTVPVGFDRKVNIDSSFLASLQTEDICKIDFTEHADDILIIHGTNDEIVQCGVVSDFADENIIEIVKVDGADHRFQNPSCREIATKSALAFFGLS